MFCMSVEQWYWPVTVQSPCRVKKISMNSNVLPLHFAPSQASLSQSSIVDNFKLYCEVDSLKPSYSESSLTQIFWTLFEKFQSDVAMISACKKSIQTSKYYLCIDWHSNLSILCVLMRKKIYFFKSKSVITVKKNKIYNASYRKKQRHN